MREITSVRGVCMCKGERPKRKVSVEKRKKFSIGPAQNVTE